MKNNFDFILRKSYSGWQNSTSPDTSIVRGENLMAKVPEMQGHERYLQIDGQKELIYIQTVE